MKRYTPTLEAFSWANSEDCDTEVMPVMAETPDGAYVKRDEADAECEWLRRENARLQRKANELPGLTATLDEYAHFARLVGECLTQHDESNGCVTGVKQPDGPITARVRAALAGLSPIPERPGDKHPPASVDGPRSEHQHTGATAFWCGICGDCVCPRDSNGECHFDNEKCPLHRAGSAHVEGPRVSVLEVM